MKNQNHNRPPHGSHVYEEPNCHCKHEVCESKREAVAKMVRNYSAMPRNWLKIVLEALAENHEVPMWGTCFIVDSPHDVQRIKNLFLKNVPDDDCFPDWHSVGETGFLGRELDGEMVLAIEGAGYCFYAHHWEPLYDALGYQWHRSPDDASPEEQAFES